MTFMTALTSDMVRAEGMLDCGWTIETSDCGGPHHCTVLAENGMEWNNVFQLTSFSFG